MKKWVGVALFLLTALAWGGVGQAEETWIEFRSPREGEILVARRPEICFRFLIPVDFSSLNVILDQTDITGVLERKEAEVRYRPFEVLPPGDHTLRVSVLGPSGETFQTELHFVTRHTRLFQEAVIRNELSAYYQQALKKPDPPPDTPDRKAEADLASEARLGNPSWSLGLRTHLRFLDQSTPLSSGFYGGSVAPGSPSGGGAVPLQKGLDLTSWLFTGEYQGEGFLFQGDLGDVMINETPNTFNSLARRGGYFRLEAGSYALRFFSVKGDQVYGLKGGTGLSLDSDRHIVGMVGEGRWFGEKLGLKVLYAEGEESASYFGMASSGGSTRGDVLALVMEGRFSERLSAEAELDFSRYDPDTSDEFGRESSSAWRIRLGGTSGSYRYEALYEYFGRDYDVVGQSPLKDREGFALSGGLFRGVHSLDLRFSRYHDNVEGDSLFPRTYDTQLGVNYTWTRFSRAPITLFYQKNIQDSRHEPEGSFPVKIHTDTFGAQVGLMLGALSLNLSGNYAFMNDRTPQDYDTATLTLSFMPAYNGETLSLSTGVAYNESRTLPTGAKTWTWTYTLDLRKSLLSGKASFDLGGTYNMMKDNQGNTDQRNLDLRFNLGYNLRPLIRGSLKSSLQLRGEYRRLVDRVYDHSDEEYGIYLLLNIHWSFSI